MIWFWVIVLVAIIGAVAVVAAGAGDSMAEVYDDRPDATLPAGRTLRAEDLRTLRLNTGVRGYRMDEVDALLDRLQAEMLTREAEDERSADERRADDERSVREWRTEVSAAHPDDVVDAPDPEPAEQAEPAEQPTRPEGESAAEPDRQDETP